MGNANKKKNKKSNEKKSPLGSGNSTKQVSKNEAYKDKDKIILEKYEPKNISYKLLSQQRHTQEKDPIEEVITYPTKENSIIIACRSGKIKELSNITGPSNKQQFKTLYSFSKRIYSLILLKLNANKFCVGLENKIVILNLNSENTLEKEIELTCKDEGPIFSLLELSNGNIISSGHNITLWQKDSSKRYNKCNSVPIGNQKIANLVEFPNYNTILATQENTHIIYLLKNEGNSINLIDQKENIPSIGYKSSAEMLTKNYMLLVGKFELNVIDPQNGVVCSRYPGIDRGSLLNLTQNHQENDFWVVTNYFGRYIEFYQQEGNDLIYCDKIEFDDAMVNWGNNLVRINKECFAAVNYYGYILVFQVKKISK